MGTCFPERYKRKSSRRSQNAGKSNRLKNCGTLFCYCAQCLRSMLPNKLLQVTYPSIRWVKNYWPNAVLDSRKKHLFVEIYQSKGRHHKEKHIFFRALPKLGKKKKTPPPSNSGNLVTFFWTSNRRFARMTEKKYH